jgi:two-component system, NtrC family, sensor kinase
MVNKIFSLPLFWKFTVAIIIVVSIFGSANLYFLNYSINDLFEKELSNNGLISAKILADRSVEPILYNDLASLNKLVSEVKRNDKNIAYAFILDANNNVLAHTFPKEVPTSLINIDKENQIQTINLEYKKGLTTLIRDISAPIIDSSVGKVRIGFYEDQYFKTLNLAKSFFLGLVVLFLIVGIIGAFIFSYIITKPIKLLSSTAKNLNLSQFNIKTLNQDKREVISSWQNPFGVHDEIDDLFGTFKGMIKRLEKTYTELQNTQESLMQSEKIAAIGILSAGIAHEINNPIAGIQNCLKRIAENPNNVKQNIAYIELMDDAIHKIKSVVQGLLNFSRKQDLVFTEVNIKQIIEDTLILIAYQFEKSRIIIVKNYSEEVPKIYGSFNHLEQVFLNLFINAIDAIDEKKLNNENFNGELDISVFKTTQYLGVKIKDNGIGIPEDKLKQIFDPFYTLKKIKQGTGLGLAVSLNILQQHHGKISVKNNADGGVTFSIYLPLIK